VRHDSVEVGGVADVADEPGEAPSAAVR
jgi:hypothetical protein